MIGFKTIEGDDIYQDKADVLAVLAKNSKLVDGASYFIVNYRNADNNDVISVDDILDVIGNRAYSLIGDPYQYDYENVSAGAKGELKNLLLRWADKYINMAQYKIAIGDPSEKMVTMDELLMTNSGECV